MPASFFAFGEWLPDQASTEPGILVQCDNVVASADCYRPHGGAFPIASSTLPAQPYGMYQTGQYIYAGTTDRVYVSDSLFTMVARTATLSATFTEWEFERFNDKIIAVNTNTVPIFHTFGSASTFATLAASGSVPASTHIGTIGQFLMVSPNSGTTPSLRWSAINDPTNWPTPNSATAIATQAGEQFFDPQYGVIQKIISGDQYGLVFQEQAITRVTYIGPPAVFQFDYIDTSHGLRNPGAAVKAGPSTYFLGTDGFYVTDGASIISTGAGKIDKTFLIDAGASTFIRATYDDKHKCVMWSYGSATVRAVTAVCLSLENNRWTKLDLFTMNGTNGYINSIVPFSSLSHGVGPFFYDTNFVLNSFGATMSGAAYFRSGDLEFNTGGYSAISRVRPIVDGATAGAITVQHYTRNNLVDVAGVDSISQSVTARDGFCHFRLESRYHNLQVRVSGGFTKAIGVELDAFPTSET